MINNLFILTSYSLLVYNITALQFTSPLSFSDDYGGAVVTETALLS